MKPVQTVWAVVFWSASVFIAVIILAVLGLMILLIFPVLSKDTLLILMSGSWSPLQGHFGIGAMVAGTFFISFSAMCLSFPVSLGVSFFISITQPKGLGKVVKKMVELMTAVPTVIYGFVGIFLLVPLVRQFFFEGSGMCILSAAIMLAILISPTMILFFIQSFSSTPKSHINAVDALGGTPAQRFFYVILPGAWPGMLTGIILSFGRATGDTLIALMISGNSVAMPESLLDSARTLTAHIALVVAADFDSMEFKTLFACGISLYILTCTGVFLARYAGRSRVLRP